MEENSLLPLSHITHTAHGHSHTHVSHAHVPNPNSCELTGEGEDDAPFREVDEDGPPDDPIATKVRQEFTFSDFYSLASRVLDGGDASKEKLEALKLQWDSRFPDSTDSRVAAFRRLIPRLLPRVSFLPRRSVTPPLPDEPAEQSSSPNILEPVSQPASDSCTNFEKGQPSSPEVFVGNIKISMPSSDNIADAFLQSTRKTLRYIQPTYQKDEIIIRPTTAMVEDGSKRWHSTAVGFKTVAFMEEAIEEGPWLFQGQPVVLQAWEQGMSLRRQKHFQIPVWIRLRHLPMEYWTVDGLSAIASGIGPPLYTDKITQSCSRLDYAQVCVMVNYNSKLPKHLVVISPILRDGKECPIKVDIEHEWLPLRCTECRSLGHNGQACPDRRIKKPGAPVTVFVQKQKSTPADPPADADTDLAADMATGKVYHDVTKPYGDVETCTSLRSESIKGKEVVVYNPFAILGTVHASNEDDLEYQMHSTIAGPNSSSPARGPT
ncbi:UNVERIFIED_CONTAM: hypothetical protein Sradi_3170100 [Sesamum radiatum]|uniref:DUF4283 domain-containing protein n=1 Tax=Sesamum radiatum TaxID=300843 RepID=A0AAW2RGD5_SESRA